MPERTFVKPGLLLALAALLLVAARPARAQGTLAGQGFGFAPGQLSTRALSNGGAISQFDPHSPLNPASLGSLNRTTIYLQYEPEFRQVRLGDDSDGSRLIRYPLAFVAFPASQRLTIGLSTSTLLDRTWTSRFDFTVPVTDGEAEGTGTFASTGAINDVRLGAAWAFGEAIRVGAGAHAITGQNRLAVNGTFLFPDSLGTAPLSERSILSYGGYAGSLGVNWQPTRVLAVSASGLKGGVIRSYRNDSVQTSARVPDRVGAGVAYSGIRGASLALNADWQGWSSLESLRDPRLSNLRAFDGWGAALGAELEGPSWFQQTIPVRAGLRYRMLPFGAGDEQVREVAIASGLGVPVARGRGTLDLAIQRASRSASGLEAKETAWTLSLGLTVRP